MNSRSGPWCSVTVALPGNFSSCLPIFQRVGPWGHYSVFFDFSSHGIAHEFIKAYENGWDSMIVCASTADSKSHSCNVEVSSKYNTLVCSWMAYLCHHFKGIVVPEVGLACIQAISFDSYHSSICYIAVFGAMSTVETLNCSSRQWFHRLWWRCTCSISGGLSPPNLWTMTSYDSAI